MPRARRHLLRPRLVASALWSLPPWLLVGWYVWGGLTTFWQTAPQGPGHAPTVETFQILVHDQLARDSARLNQSTTGPATLDRIAIKVKQKNWEALLSRSPDGARRGSVPARLYHDGKKLKSRLSLRGNGQTKVTTTQKSLGIKVKEGALVDGYRDFVLVNDPAPFIVGDEVLLSLARELGLLTPATAFKRVSLNGRDLGVFRFRSDTDESLLRSRGRIPGNIYRGGLKRGQANEELWQRAHAWSRSATSGHAALGQADFADLQEFLDMIRHATVEEFQAFAARHLDLHAFAELDALDVAFASEARDYRDNHRWYHDPYRDRWEPIVIEFDAFRADPAFNAVENPLLLRLKLTPGYLQLRDRRLYELLTGRGTPAAVEQRAEALLTALAPDLESDARWNAYHLLPPADDYLRRLMRPHSLEKLRTLAAAELAGYRYRHGQLLDALQENPLFLEAGRSEPVGHDTAGEGAPTLPLYNTPLSVLVDGRAGVRVTALQLELGAGCASPSPFELWAGDRHLGTETRSTLSGGRDLAVQTPLELVPALALVPRPEPSRRRGRVQAEVVPARYDLELRSPCPLSRVSAVATQLITGAQVHSKPPAPEQFERVPRARLAPNDVPSFNVGDVSAEANPVTEHADELVELGPGVIELPDGQVFNERQHVIVHAGTTLRVGSNSSLVFFGRTEFIGEPGRPIVVERLEPTQPWGGLAVHGESSAGSTFTHVTLSGGSVATHEGLTYPGMVNLHDTHDIALRHCRVGANSGVGDLVHAVYVRHLVVAHCLLSDSGGDGLDLELVDARVTRLNTRRIADDALDLMTARVTVDDSTLLGAGGNAVSAGERSNLLLRNSLIASAPTGLLAKNASQAELLQTLIFDAEVGVRTYRRDTYYAGNSVVSGDALHIVSDRGVAVVREEQTGRRRAALDRGTPHQHPLRKTELARLRTGVLGLEAWVQLGTWVETELKTGAPP